MDKRFPVLRIIGTLWKVLAWIMLIGGVLLSLGILLVGILGSGGFLLQFLGEDVDALPQAMGIMTSVVGFASVLVVAIVYFLVLYAVGDLIYLLLSIEKNSRRTMELLEGAAGSSAEEGSAPPTL